MFNLQIKVSDEFFLELKTKWLQLVRHNFVFMNLNSYFEKCCENTIHVQSVLVENMMCYVTFYAVSLYFLFKQLLSVISAI